MRYVFFCIVTAGTLSLVAPGCTQPTSSSSSPVATGAASAPVLNSRRLGHFTAKIDPATHTMAITPVGTPIVLDDNLEPMSLDPIPIGHSDAGAGQPTNTVDLVSTNCIDGYPASHTFQCDVELRSFFTRSLANVYVEIDSVTLSGSAISGYDATNSDAEFDTPDGNLANTHGLWSYTNASENAAAISPVLTSQATGFNTGTRTWKLANASDESISYDILVYATKGFPGYTFTVSSGNGTYGNEGYIDACTGGTSVTSPATRVSLPFDFTLYNTNTTDIHIARNGQITLGVAPTAASAAVLLPSPTAGASGGNLPRPVFFPFWDDLKYGTSGTPGRICYQTIGAAPNRQFVVEWRNMTFGNAPDESSSLDFEVYLYEGTGEIDTVYNTMTGASGDTSKRESGALAWVGMQNESASVATGEFHMANYGSANFYKYIPSPGCPAGDSRTNGRCAFPLARGQYEPFALALDGTNVYWTNNYNGTVMRVPTGGGHPVTIASAQGHPEDIAVNAANVYWSTGTNLVELPLTGGSTTTLASGQNAPWAVAADGIGVYWTNEGTHAGGFRDGAVMQLPLGGQASALTLASGQYAPGAIAVDANNLYWANLGAGAIMQTSRGASAGTSVTLASGAVAGAPRNIAVDATSVYWTNYATAGTVMKVPIGGGTATTLASGQPYPYGIAVDSTSVYWTNDGNGTVMMVPLTGGSPTTLASGQGDPEGIAVDATNVYWITRGNLTFNGTVVKARKN